MQCERCGMQLEPSSARASSVQCRQCGNVVSTPEPGGDGQPVFVLDPDDSDIFSVDGPTHMDKPLSAPAPIGRVATSKKSTRLGDMLFLDVQPAHVPSEDLPQGNHQFTSHSDIYHYDALERVDALKLPGAESTAPHRLPPEAVSKLAPPPTRVPQPQPVATAQNGFISEPDKPTVIGALLGGTLTIVVLAILGLGLFRFILGLTPPTTNLGIEQFTEALQGGESTLTQSDGVIISSYRSTTYPTGSQSPVLLIFGEVENHRDIDIKNVQIKAELIDELGMVVATETMPIGLKFTPPEFAGLRDIHKLSQMVTIKSEQADATIAARSSRTWSIALAAPLTDIHKLEHRISLLQKETPEN
jgi:hypothetical protein